MTYRLRQDAMLIRAMCSCCLLYTSINDIVRARVDDEEGFYIFLNSFLKIKPDTKNDALFLYEEKYRAEKLVCLLSVCLLYTSRCV